MTGFLLVGTTGDYAPFSYYDNGVLVGTDIEKARSIAKSLGVKAKFIRTTWSQLSQDLADKKFHMALSGITVKPERKTVGYFSKPYVFFGKMPISLCKKAKELNTMKSIDRKKVRVIVNPGGTNESFTRENIRLAR